MTEHENTRLCSIFRLLLHYVIKSYTSYEIKSLKSVLKYKECVNVSRTNTSTHNTKIFMRCIYIFDNNSYLVFVNENNN